MNPRRSRPNPRESERRRDFLGELLYSPPPRVACQILSDADDPAATTNGLQQEVSIGFPKEHASTSNNNNNNQYSSKRCIRFGRVR
jgi:hypothetical protein